MEKQQSPEHATLRGEAAAKALQKLFKRLVSAVTVGLVPHSLYSEELIDKRTMELFTNQSQTDTDKGTAIVLHLQKAVKIDPTKFDNLCEIFREEDLTKDLASNLKDELDQQLSRLKASTSSNNGIELGNLRKKLEVYVADRSSPEKQQIADDLIKSAIMQYIESLIEAGMTTEALKEHFLSLCQNEPDIFPTDFHKWISETIESLQLSSQLHRTLSLSSNSSPTSPAQRRKPPRLFCKDTLYHAGLCCQGVTTCKSSSDLSKFLSTHGHTLAECSLSCEDTGLDQYLIATQGKNLYVAFKSIPNIQNWLQKYKSFSNGIEKQTSVVPLRFFIEQLQLGKRIVITGFSFGGLLACSVAAKLWKETYASVGLLKENVICITFGQPLIKMLFIQEAIKDFPGLEEMIHLIYYKGDIIPGLFHYFRLGCHHYTTMKSLGNTTSKTTKPNGSNENLGTQDVDFKCQFAEGFLPYMATLQEEAMKKPSYSGALASRLTPQQVGKAVNDLKDTLQLLIENASVDFKPESGSLPGTCYLISTEERKGLTWSEPPKSTVASVLYVDKAAIDKIDNTIFKKHNMENYQKSMFRCYLEKEPSKFPIPTHTLHVNKAVKFIEPSVTGLECHMYPKENVLVVEGDNLWFCYEVSIGKNKKPISIPAHSISRKSIQVNYKQSSQDANEYASSCEQMRVTLLSHFSKPVQTEVEVKQNRYSFSVRQIQLAKHTPTEVIELAYWTAMLERNSNRSDQQLSERYTAIIRFLEEAVNIVPLESILHAIAYSSDSTALECVKALKASKIKMPQSVVAGSALVDACIHVSTGLQLADLDKEELTAFRKTFMFERMLRQELSQLSSALIAPSEPRSYSDIVQGQRIEEDLLSPLLHSFGPFWSLILPMFALTRTLESMSHNPLDQELADFMEDMLTKTLTDARHKQDLPIISKKLIKQLYPVSPLRHTMHIPTLQSPVKILKDAREQLKSLEDTQNQGDESIPEGRAAANEQMLAVVKDIHDSNLQVCTALLAAFMEQQIHIPLLSSPEDMASNILSASSAPVAMGVWTLFSMSLRDLRDMLNVVRGNALYVEIESYIAGVLDQDSDEEETTEKKAEEQNYAGKLQFLLQGIEQTATCSTEYISYSLEYQLCKHLKFDKSLTVNDLIKNWNTIFRNDALSLVAAPYRPLIARWLKWVLLVHDLRETLARYTCVGVIGLVNSGKSQLAMVGTLKSKRTTVPFMYNYDGIVDGFDVIDFPGVDDKDTVPELAKLLVSLSQAVVFVVDYRKINSEPAQAWLECLTKDSGHIPVLVCLTFADRLLVECQEKAESKELCHKKIELEFENIKEKLGFPIELRPRITVKLCCFNINTDSTLTPEDLQAAEISQTQDVGKWLVDLFRSNDQGDLADKLARFIDL